MIMCFKQEPSTTTITIIMIIKQFFNSVCNHGLKARYKHTQQITKGKQIGTGLLVTQGILKQRTNSHQAQMSQPVWPANPSSFKIQNGNKLAIHCLFDLQAMEQMWIDTRTNICIHWCRFEKELVFIWQIVKCMKYDISKIGNNSVIS